MKFSLSLFLSAVGSSVFFCLVQSQTYSYVNNGHFIGVYTGGSSITWQNANNYCSNVFGTELASIHSATENNLAIAALNSAGMPDILTGSRGGTAGNNAWIGFNDLTTEGTFVWEDGTTIDYTNWHDGEPNNCCTDTVEDGEDCTHIWGTGTWNDLSCDPSLLDYTVSGFVCNTEPCSTDTNNWHDLTGDGNVVACHGTFSGGLDDTSVDAICGNDWHVCDSAQEAADLGLTLSQCQSVGNNEIFFARESSNGNALCDSVHNTAGSNDVWGCSGGSTSDLGGVCLNLYDTTDAYNYPTCLTMSHFCWSGNGGTIYDSSTGTTPVVGFGSNGGNEYNNAFINDDSYGGVLCCKNEQLCDNGNQDAMCWANGDVHIRGFDGTYYHYMGDGYFDYVAPCNGEVGTMPFLISGRQNECPPWDPFTCLFEIIVTVGENIVQISFPRDGSNPTLVSDGSEHVGTFSFADGSSSGSYTTSATSFSGTFTDATTGDEITISFTYSGYSLKVTTSSDCMNDRICGLCGSLDGDATNDFTKRDGGVLDNTGSGTWPVPDDIWDNVNEFGDSWCNEQLTNNPDCVGTNVDQPDPDCIEDAQTKCEYVWNDYCSDCNNNELNYYDWIEACKFDACAASGQMLDQYSTHDALNNGFFDSSLDACSAFCEDVPREPFVVSCFVCSKQCTSLTSEYGCAGNECLDTCRNCVSDIDWWDYENGQSGECQCHNNGCDQCEPGFFKIDYDFPCQSCSGLIGCSHCTDFWGCQQCNEGFEMVESSTCGEDSVLNTGNTKFHYCVPIDGSDCTVGDVRHGGGDDDDTPPPTGDVCPKACDEDPCDCWFDDNCDNCQNCGCVDCNPGFFKKSWGHECTSCYQFDKNCATCGDWQGCTECNGGYMPVWDQECQLNRCEMV